jgi:NADH dehydrogenase
VIAVAGGTGRLGTLVVPALAERGEQVRVLTRDPRRAAHLVGQRVEVATADLRERDATQAALAGAGCVLAAAHGFIGPRGVTPTSVDRDGNRHLIDAARTHGAEVVLMSIVGATPDSRTELFRMKHAAETHLHASGVPATVVRSTAFAELWIDLLRHTAARGGRPVVFGRGTNPINFVSVRDVAALVEHALLDPTTRGETFEIGGPNNITLTELARQIQAADGRTAPPRHVPPPMLHLLAQTAGRINPQFGRQARAALAMDTDDLSFDATPLRTRFPELPCTPLTALLPQPADPPG